MPSIAVHLSNGLWTLENQHILLTLDPCGHILSICNKAAEETYNFHESPFSVVTADGSITPITSQEAFASRDEKADLEALHYIFRHPRGDFELVYSLKSSNAFFRRTIIWKNTYSERLYDVAFGNLALTVPAKEAIHYLTFWVAPTVEFLRFQKGSIFTGIENPFYRAETGIGGAALSFSPGLILKPGESYTSEPQFIGVTPLSGIMIEDSGRKFRYPNASGYIPIDRNESRAMRKFAFDYLHPSQDSLQFINYQFFHPLPSMPSTEADINYHRHAIDSFAAIGGERILFSPLHPYTKPDAEHPFWDLWPDDPESPARQIIDYADSRHIQYGFYMGCAAHPMEGNSAGLNFRPDHPEWKKKDAQGRRADDNCLACDDYFEWWLNVQDTTIKKYHLSIWCWDPSWGSGMNCHDETHGHIAGMGAYKGWRRCMELSRRLKESNPGLFIQTFYGTKQFGLWGLSSVDGHEVYNEQTAIVSTHHTQISDDRQNADGIRFQNNWSMRFRFLPAVMGHPLIGHPGEMMFNPDETKACDYYGWKYAFFSALAISGTLMPIFLPFEADLLPGYTDFYQKWIRWARKNWNYVQYTEPFGEQVEAGAIDGYARIKDDHGFIFLFNGNPRASRIRFELGDEICFYETKGDYEFIELFPADNSAPITDTAGHTCFAPGDSVELEVQADSCLVLELRRIKNKTLPVLAASSGTLTVHGSVMTICGLTGLPGTAPRFFIRHPAPASVTQIIVNGIPITRFVPSPDGLCFQFSFGGEFHQRELNDWSFSQNPTCQMLIPNHEPQPESQRIVTNFYLASDTPDILAASRPKNYAEMDGQLAIWQKSDDFQYSYHNFICERPYRLWLVIPFLHCPPAASSPAVINGTPAELSLDPHGYSWYSDVTELVTYGAHNTLELVLPPLQRNEFMGPYLLYPPETPVQVPQSGFNSQSPSPSSIVYNGILDQLPHHRYDPIYAPKILNAYATGPVTYRSPTQVIAKIDMPPEKLRGVYCTQSGFPWMGIEEMKWISESDTWQVTLYPGERRSIQENEFVYIWAESTDGMHSDFMPVRIEWEFRD